MHEAVTTIYMIDDSDDEAFVTQMYFNRERIELDLQHYFDLDGFLGHVSDDPGFDPIASLVVVDLNLRSSRGTGVVRHIRTTAWGGDLIVGICSGSEDPADRDSALGAGADFFVSKPLNRNLIEALCANDPRLSASTDPDQPLLVSRLVPSTRQRS